jgi:hypothetical protein
MDVQGPTQEQIDQLRENTRQAVLDVAKSAGIDVNGVTKIDGVSAYVLMDALLCCAANIAFTQLGDGMPLLADSAEFGDAAIDAYKRSLQVRLQAKGAKA